MSGNIDPDDDQCVDCLEFIYLDCGDRWPGIGPICYGCLVVRLEKAEARVKELEDFTKEVITAEDDSPWAEDSAVNLQFLARQAKAILWSNK